MSNTWRADFAVFDRILDRRLDEVQRGAALLVAEGVSAGLPRFALPGTPFETGFARSSWSVGVNGMPSFRTPPKRPAGVNQFPAPDLSPSLAVVGAGDEVIVATNVEYMPRLEYGHSQQAPQGFVRLTVAAFPRLVRAVAQRLGVRA